MAISIDFTTKIITIPQADLTLISGSLYELKTETKFRADINALMDDETGIVFDDPILHNTEVSIVGTTYARFIEVINGYSITFENLLMTVRIAESNNNLFDVEAGILNDSGNVTVVGQNSAGLIIRVSGSGLSAAQDARLKETWQRMGLDVDNAVVISDTQIAFGSKILTITEGPSDTTVQSN